MAMDIKNLSQIQPRTTADSRQSVESRKSSGAGAQPPQVPGGTQGDQVTLTDTARLLGDLAKSAGSQPVVNAERVAEIRQAIEEGRYEVNAERVAAKLIQSDALL